MTSHPAISAVRALCAILVAENDALQRMDVIGATALLAQKQIATDAVLASRTAMPLPDESAWLVEGERLTSLAHDNKRLLERAMVAQNRVMACIARAVPRAMPQSTRYGCSGQMPMKTTTPPIALLNSA